jgi:hypothetical protein
MRPRLSPILAATLLIGVATPLDAGRFAATAASPDDLSDHFGFEELEVVKIGNGAGPIICADVDRDGRSDLVAVNNHDSRIEIHYQRRDPRPDAVETVTRVNEFPEHWRFRRELVSVTHRVTGIVAHDYDGDGLTDLVYAGVPSEVVFVRQSPPGVFEVARRQRVRDLAATRDGLAVADLVGDAAPELIAIVDGAINVYPLEGESLGPPQTLGGGGRIIAVVIDDFDGNGRTDVVGIIPDDAAPIRLWLGGEEDGGGAIAAEVRFEMPPVIECTSVRLPGEAAARLAVIERASKRVVVYEIASERIAESGDRDAAIRVRGFDDAGNRKRDHTVADVDGDGRLDLVVTDTEANALVLYRQRADRGLQSGESFPSLSEITYLVAGDVDDDDAAELFVLSEKEGVVGRVDLRDGTLPFPVPVDISAGHTPTALNLVDLERGPRLAVVGKDGRDYVLDLIDMAGALDTIDLGKLSRSPDAIVALDADQDGRTDLLLFTRDKPMMMLHAGEDGFTLTESKDMGQFGLVKAARFENTSVFDVDGDGRDELLIADANYVRAVRYEPDPAPGVSPGWQVVAQINARDSSSSLVSVARLRPSAGADDAPRMVAADKDNDRLVVMAPSPGGAGAWHEVESLTVRGFAVKDIHAGAFSGDDIEDIIAIGDDGFAVIRLRGERIVLHETAAWRSSEERRIPHELGYGDVNGDGFTDMVCLDAGEQMCDIFTFTETGRMLHAIGFQTFESRFFSSGEPREFEPRQVIAVDVTGDAAEDIVLLAHDRVLIYPQMTEPD